MNRNNFESDDFQPPSQFFAESTTDFENGYDAEFLYPALSPLDRAQFLLDLCTVDVGEKRQAVMRSRFKKYLASVIVLANQEDPLFDQFLVELDILLQFVKDQELISGGIRLSDMLHAATLIDMLVRELPAKETLQ